jgi:MFS transporter, MHS family, proline/betaine transporter
LVTSTGFSWRYAFCFGVVIALIGTKARTALKETPDFADAKRQLKRELEVANIDIDELKDNSILKEAVNKKG